jgi:hypothetical protein
MMLPLVPERVRVLALVINSLGRPVPLDVVIEACTARLPDVEDAEILEALALLFDCIGYEVARRRGQVH